jgi:mRNA interferase HigB
MRRLREFWQVHKRAEKPLKAWAKRVERADWQSFADVKSSEATADKVAHQTIFDIGGNKYRIVAAINFEWHVVYVRFVLTHLEYDQEHWKKDTFGKDWG